MLTSSQVFDAQMTKIALIETQLEKANDLIKKLTGEKLSILKNKLIRCAACGKNCRVGDWSFVQKFWYVPPHGCTGGDYWKPNEIDTCDISCPRCGSRNYIYNHPQKQKILEIIKTNPLWNKESLFKEVIKHNVE